ncbi:DNA helicase/exodeoxyribonuclease V, subunit B [Lachnospiraceae bacterium XBB1006]|nr:DNA helicase/exodeoxyribonuclease V, subunit B [Lachnospiraceae bacterium XBB1006]
MALNMIVGRAGSGKSTFLYEKIISEAKQHPQQTYLVLVPEQFTLSTQKEFVKRSEHGCIMNIDVLSFERLAYRVFEELGMGDVTVLEDIGKTLLIRRIVRKRNADLKVLRRNIDKPGYLDQVKSLLTEFSQYHVQPEELHQALANMKEGLLYYKLQDLTMIYEELNDAIKERFLTQETLLCLLADVVGDSEWVKNSVLVFDGYTGFTPVQRVFVKAVMPLVKELYVTVTLEPMEYRLGVGKEHELFYLSQKYVSSLVKLAEETGTIVAKPLCMKEPEERRFTRCAGLAALEKNLFRPRKTPYLEACKDVEIVCRKNPREELTYVASMIYRYREMGLRYQEMAIVTADLDTYADEIGGVLKKAGIPYFIDQKKKVTLNAFVEVILGLLELVEEDFTYEGVFRYLKTGFSNLTDDEVQELENYCLAARIHGGAMYQYPFSKLTMGYEAQDLVSINAIREKVVEPVMAFYETRSAKYSVKERCQALYSCLEALHIKERLDVFADQLQEKQEGNKAREYKAIYDTVFSMFQKYVALMGEETMPFSEFREMVAAGLAATKVAILPAGRDCVVLGDMERTRLEHIKVLFFVGVSEGVIPRVTSGSMCLSQREREMLLEQKIELAAGPKERIFTGQFYLYQMMAKPSQKLYVTYPAYSMGGEVKNPSYIVGVIRDILPNVTQSKGEDVKAEEAYFCPEMAFSYCLQQPFTKESQELLAYLKQDDMFKERIQNLASAALGQQDIAQLEEALLKRLYGDEVKGSITRLETFAHCRRRHFLEYGLKLKERNTGQFTLMDVGILMHGAMEYYAKALEKSEYEADTIPDEMRIRLAEEAVQAAVAELSQTFLFENARNNYQIERVRRIVRRATWAMGKHKQEDGYVPTYFEKKFFLEPEAEPQMLQLPGGMAMRLNGKIDRIDVKQMEEELHYRVVDYKSGNTGLDYNQVYAGCQLQLVTYDYAGGKIIEQEQKQAGACDGVYYFHMKDPLVKLEPGEGVGVVESKLQKELALDGAEEEGLDTLLAYTKYKIHALGCDMIQGEVTGNPTKEADVLYCAYCPYQGSCGFEEDGEQEAIRLIEKEKPEDVLLKMKETMEKGTNNQ